MRFLLRGAAVATLLTLVPSSFAQPSPAPGASAEDAVEPPPARLEPKTNTHTYVEGRLGMVGLSPLGVRDDGALRFGPAVEGSVGIAFTWLDLGLAARLGTVPVTSGRESYLAFGPEVAFRKALLPGNTLRIGVVPLYAIVTGPTGSHARYGADLLAQYLFTLDDVSRPAWRLGVGLRAGRWVAVGEGAPGWTMGVDFLVRSWW